MEFVPLIQHTIFVYFYMQRFIFGLVSIEVPNESLPDVTHGSNEIYMFKDTSCSPR